MLSYLPQLPKIHYLSDGSCAQYKNYKNFANLIFHVQDFGITAEWNFFATSHGKNLCDGVGGTAKRLATRASLQRPLDNQILTPYQLFEFASQDISGITSFYVDSETVKKRLQLSLNHNLQRLNISKVPGTITSLFLKGVG